MGALTLCRTLGDLRQHAFMLLQRCRSEIRHGSHWADVEGSWLPSFWRLWGEIHILAPSASRGTCVPWLMAPSSVFKASSFHARIFPLFPSSVSLVQVSGPL